MFSATHRLSNLFPHKILLNEKLYGFTNDFTYNLLYSKNRKQFSSGNVETMKPIRMAFTSFEEAMPLNKDEVPVIIIHGLFGSKMNWNSLGKVVQKETRKKVYAVDARNHGESPHTPEHSYFHMAEDIKLFMTEHNIERAALVGHSMGGRAVMAFSLLYPQKVESLTVVDISPIGTPRSMKAMESIFTAMKAVKLATGVGLYDARKTAEDQLSALLKDQKLASFLTMNLVERSKGEFSWKVNLDAITRLYHPHVTVFPIKDGEYKGRTLFICGGDSDFVNFDDIDKIKVLFPEAIFIKIDNCGHWVHADQPKQFLQILCNFLVGQRLQNL